MIHVFIGTKAQYIKTAPVLRALDAAGVPYRLIDSGQHARLMETLRPELGIRAPDYYLRQGSDISRVGGGMWWLLRQWWRGQAAPARLRREVFGGQGGVCLVHGDTVSTLLAAHLARRAGLGVAHLEAGLHSGSWRDPFPEELVRRLVTRMSDLLFAPSAWAAEHLRRVGARGAVVNLGANTGAEAAAWALARGCHPLPDARGYVLVTIHRFETLCRRARLRFVVALARRAAARRPVIVVLHEPTRLALQRQRLLERLTETPQVRVLPLQPYGDFLQLLAHADALITDGGSVQEESAYLGVPCVVLRDHTERPEGMGENVTVVPFEAAAVERFLADPAPWRRPAMVTAAHPSHAVVETLRTWQPPAASLRTAGRTRMLGWFFSASLLAWLAWLMRREAARVTLWPGAGAWTSLILAALIMLAATCWAAWWWTRLARAVGVRVPTPQLLRLWARSLLAKYAPGGWWQPASRWYLAQQAGASATTAMLAIILEQAFVLLAGVMVLFVVWWLPDAGRGWRTLAGGWWVAVAAVVLSSGPWWLPWCARWMGRRLGLSLDVRHLSLRTVLRCAAGYCGYWWLVWMALSVLLHGWPVVTWGAAGTAALMYIAAFVVGALCPWAPAGLGVREGVFAWSSAPLVGTGVAAAMAAVARLWLMVVDGLASLVLARFIPTPRVASDTVEFISGVAYPRSYFDRLQRVVTTTSRHGRARLRNVSALLQGLTWRRLLDVGTGSGTFAIACSRADRLVVGMDYSEVALRMAQAAVTAERRPSFTRADVGQLPFRDAAFDLILMADIAEHVPPPVWAQSLEECRRLLAPGGHLVVYTPNRLHLFEWLRRWRLGLAVDPTHIHLLTMPELLRDVRQHGFHPLQACTQPSHLPFVSAIERVLGRLPVVGTLFRRRLCVVAAVRTDAPARPSGAPPVSPQKGDA